MEHKIKTALVIGGINVDIWGSPSGEFRLYDSNPGRVALRPGGVGRNIAHNLSLLGMRVDMLTALGGDSYADFIRSHCRVAGIGLGLAECFPEERSSTYMYITDGEGDMVTAINDMDIVNRLSPEVVEKRLELINGYDAVVIDANLPEETVKYIAEVCTPLLYADPVSCAKASRLIPALGRLRAIKPNHAEAEVLTGCSDPEAAALKLVEAGISKVFVSLGENGIISADSSGVLLHTPAEKAAVVNTNGAGDSACAAVIFGDAQGMSLEEISRLAVSAGALTASCEETNNPSLASIL